MMNTCDLYVPSLLTPFALPKVIAPQSFRMVDQPEVEQIARRVIRKAQEPSAMEFLADHQWDRAPENYPAWDMFFDLFDQIAAHQGAAHAFRSLLVNAESFRTASLLPGLNPGEDFVTGKLYAMASRIAQAAQAELDQYDRSGEDASRPADIYRRYGLALRYATETLGSLEAREALARLMLASPLPVDELENPDWIDPYTAEVDPEYVQIRVKNVSSAGNGGEEDLPALVRDLLENMEFGEAMEFYFSLKAQGLDLHDYWMQFLEAQRSGYTNLPEPEEEREEVAFDAIEKDYTFKEDLRVDYDEVEQINAALAMQIPVLRTLIAQTAKEADEARRAGERYNWNGAHRRFITNPAAKAVVEKLTRLGCTYHKREIIFRRNPLSTAHELQVEVTAKPRARLASQEPITHNQLIKRFFTIQITPVKHFHPKDIMGALLPFQNTLGFWEEDLYEIHIPGDHGYTLNHWLQIHGDEFYEQFENSDYVDYGDPLVNRYFAKERVPATEPGQEELDELAANLVSEQARLYIAGEEKRKAYDFLHILRKYLKETTADRFLLGIPLHGRMKAPRVFQYKPKTRWHPAYVEAELYAAVVGEKNSRQAASAGQDAWRESIDPEANRLYKRLRAHGASHAEANEQFWKQVKLNANRIVKVTDRGVILKNGRSIDWGITLIKLQAGEIPVTCQSLSALYENLTQKRRGTPALRAYLQKRIEQMTQQ